VSTDSANQAVRLTKTLVDKLPRPAVGQAFLRDADLKGFGLRVTASGTKAFIVEKRVNGRVRRMTLGRYGELTVEQARKQAAQVLGKVATGIDPVAEKRKAQALGVTLAEVFAAFIEARKHRLRESTLRDYRGVMGRVFEDWQRKPMTAITRQMVAKRHQEVTENQGEAYANLAFRVLRAVLNFAMATYDDGQGNPVLASNPVAVLSQTRAWNRSKRRQTVIKAHQLPGWYAAVQALKEPPALESAAKAADLLCLLLFTGLRKHEALTLRWAHVDLAGRTFTIPDPKNHHPLTLPMSDYMAALFRDRQAAAVNEYVFPGRDGTGHLVEPKRQVQQVADRSGVPFTLHDLRRTFITVAEGLDIPLFAIKRLVNHSMSGDVTAGYIVSDVERLRAPMDKIAAFLLSAVQTPAE
jgi:integrase